MAAAVPELLWLCHRIGKPVRRFCCNGESSVHLKLNIFVMIVVILTEAEYNKNVITIHKNFNKNVILMHVYINKSVKECVYGTTDYEEAAGLEKFSLPQTR